MATYLFSNYLIDHTITAKVYAIPDSGLFITDYYSPIVQEQALRHNAEALFRLVNADNFMFEDCVQ